MAIAKPDLQTRIANVLDGEYSSAVIDGLLEETRKASVDTADRMQLANGRALDPRADSIASLAAHQEARKLEFECDRLAVAEQALQGALQAAQKREAETRYAAHHAAVTAKRDALAAELKAKYPKLAAELCDLLRRVEESNAEAASAGIESADSYARGIPANYSDSAGFYPRLTEVVLPSFGCESRMKNFIWHPRDPARAAS